MTSTQIKERPILFTPAMAQAIAERRKTQTRRVVNLGDIDHAATVFTGWCGDGDSRRAIFNAVTLPGPGGYIRCPYGVPGDRLWVRESWQAYACSHTDCGDEWDTWEPSGLDIDRKPDLIVYRGDPKRDSQPDRWRPNIHMPRWACRSVLEVVSLRVERLQDISEADAIAEGFTPDVCEQIFRLRAKRAKTRPSCYIRFDESDSMVEYCPECAAKKARRHEDIRYDSGETDSPQWCDTCGVLLEGTTLTEYGIGRELFLEGHESDEREHWPCSPDDAFIAARFASDVPKKWRGRLAQIGFATAIDMINGDGTWKSNPWVWVVEFKRLDEVRR